jgi:hypothetical protein
LILPLQDAEFRPEFILKFSNRSKSLIKASATFDLNLSLLFHPLPQLDGGVQLQGRTSKLAPPYNSSFPNPQKITKFTAPFFGGSTHLIQTP